MPASNTNRTIPGACDSSQFVEINNSTCLEFTQTGTGTDVDPIVYTPNFLIDATVCNNGLVCGPNGLSAPACFQPSTSQCQAPSPYVVNSTVLDCIGNLSGPSAPTITFLTGGQYGDAFVDPISGAVGTVTSSTFATTDDCYIMVDFVHGKAPIPFSSDLNLITVAGATTGTPVKLADEGYYGYHTPPAPDGGDEIGKHEVWLIPITTGSASTEITFDLVDTVHYNYAIYQVCGASLTNPVADIGTATGGYNAGGEGGPITQNLIMPNPTVGVITFFTAATAHEFPPGFQSTPPQTVIPASATNLYSVIAGTDEYACNAGLHGYVVSDPDDDSFQFTGTSNDGSNSIHRGVQLIGVSFNAQIATSGLLGCGVDTTCSVTSTNVDPCSDALVQYNVDGISVEMTMAPGNDWKVVALLDGNVIGQVGYNNINGTTDKNITYDGLSDFGILPTTIAALGTQTNVLTFEIIMDAYVSSPNNLVTINDHKIITQTIKA